MMTPEEKAARAVELQHMGSPHGLEALAASVDESPGPTRTRYLAWSLDRRVSLSRSLMPVGPRGGRKPRYCVRLGYGRDGIAYGGCCMAATLDAALACFERLAMGAP